MHDLAIIIVSTNEAHWLRALPADRVRRRRRRRPRRRGGRERLDGRHGRPRRSEFPDARVVPCANHGFAHANNRALMTVNARYVLFLNPDTEVVEGTFAALLGRIDELPDVGLAGCRQLAADGRARRDACAASRRDCARSCDALAPSGWPVRAALDRTAGARPRALRAASSSCDWTVGSFMLARREAIESAGWLDERLFLYSDEPDLGLRIKRAGWEREAPAADDDPAPRQEDGLERARARAVRLRLPAVLHQAPAAGAAADGARRAGARLRAARGRLPGRAPRRSPMRRARCGGAALRVLLGTRASRRTSRRRRPPLRPAHHGARADAKELAEPAS